MCSISTDNSGVKCGVFTDGPTSVFGTSRASCVPVGADQSSGVPAGSTVGSAPAVSSITQINQSLFTQMPTNEVQPLSFKDSSGTLALPLESSGGATTGRVGLAINRSWVQILLRAKAA